MTPKQLGRFIDELIDVRDRFEAAIEQGVPNELALVTHRMRLWLRRIEDDAGRRLPDEVVIRGRRPARARPRAPV
jgi:hypothetical protein